MPPEPVPRADATRSLLDCQSHKYGLKRSGGKRLRLSVCIFPDVVADLSLLLPANKRREKPELHSTGFARNENNREGIVKTPSYKRGSTIDF